MDDTTYIVIIIIIVVIFAAKISADIDKMNKEEKEKKKEIETEEEKEIDDSDGEAADIEDYPYVRTYLLTKNEWAFYKSIKPITDKYNIHILAKVRVADIVNVKKGLSSKNYFAAFGKIKAKHFDFVLSRPANLEVLGVVELDDNSHQDISRQQRDFFIDKLCETVRLPIIHCSNIIDFENQMCAMLKITKK